MTKKVTFKGLIEVFKNAFAGFDDNRVMKLSASLAYYTVFSMGPLLTLIISLCSIFFGREAVEGKIVEQLRSFVGADTAIQLQQIIKNASLTGKSHVAAIIGGIILVVSATTVFAEIQDSINQIWGLKPKPKRGWLKMLQNRFLSFSVIVTLGFLLLVSLILTTIIDSFSARLIAHFPDVAVNVFYIINLIITFAVIAQIFAVIFKVLPDAEIKWRDVLSGAITTAILFMIGKLAISFYISKSEVSSTYGTAGSFAVLLVWVYYSSIILYFGAEFTKAYAVKYGSEIYPSRYAVTTKLVEIETGSQSIQKTEATDIKEIPEIKKISSDEQD